jgi:hypothetical protein
MPDNPDEPRGDQLLDPARIEPQTDKMQPDAGTKMFVTFFFLIVPPLGFAILAVVCWKLYQAFMTT